VITVEVHQDAPPSTDLSFDLELSAKKTGTAQFVSTDEELVVTTQSGLNISAVFEGDGKCILPPEITSELTLHKSCSPYVASSDVNITNTGKLNIFCRPHHCQRHKSRTHPLQGKS
jgi:hypothetical protein